MFLMEEELGNFISDVLAKVLDKFEENQIRNAFQIAINRDPSLKESISNVQTTEDLEQIFKQVSGILDVYAGQGSIDIENSLINAIRCASFNHSDGTINIDGSVIQAPRLVTGGADGATGTTTIKGTNLKSKGTEIRMGKNASIRMKGGARIVQN